MPQYPGLGLNLRYHGQVERNGPEYPLGMHNNCYNSSSDLLLVREVAMMIVMDTLTDKPDWHLKVFDEDIAGKWIAEALAIPARQFDREIVQRRPDDDDPLGPRPLKVILDEGCLKYCIQELRTKAEYFKKTGIVPTLDATAAVAKSDVLVKPELHNALRDSFDKLLLDQQEQPDWHPGTNDMVLDLVHPSMHPLVYGRSLIFNNEVVGVNDAVDKWAGKGQVIPSNPQLETEISQRRYNNDDYLIGGSRVPPSYWSENYQWLPSNVQFVEGGSVKFTSYINNLHPSRHEETYHTIERLIETTLPIWDQCIVRRELVTSLKRDRPGRLAPRFPKPDKPGDYNNNNWDPPTMEGVEFEVRPVRADGSGYASDDASDEESDEWDDPQERAWVKMRQAVEPQAPTFSPVDYSLPPGAALRERHKDSGLQVIVKMASIELTPDKPEYVGGGWHVEGQMNEHIVGTALYYVDSENVTPSRLSFRMQGNPYENDEWDGVGQEHQWMEEVYGTMLGNYAGECLQYYGSVETKQGRLLAFPNVFHHRVSPFRLADDTKPGHRRFIALWLVDPLTRVISTANVPPQQQEWWVESIFAHFANEQVAAAATIPADLALIIRECMSTTAENDLDKVMDKLGKPKLPPEILDWVKQYCQGVVPMSMEEAKDHRQKLMTERTAFQDTTSTNWAEISYSFCEH